MYKKFFLLLVGSFYYAAHAQEININRYEENGRNGYQVILENEADKVEDFLSSYFKGYGKVRGRGGTYTISNLSRADFPFPDITLFSEIQRKGINSKAVVWMADSLFEQKNYSQKLNELWYTFSVDFYRQIVQQSIDESLKALRYAEKQIGRLEKDSLNLQSDLIKNRKEKLKLEQALKTNAENRELLLKNIENNSYTKDSVIIAVEKIQRLIKLQEQEKNAIQ